jgi:opacity protein-like surface antigen
MIRLLGAAAALACCLSAAQAAEVTQSITTTAKPKAVWAVIGQFDGIAGWLPGAVSSPADKGNTVGSIRLITLGAPGNPTVKEKLTAYKKHSYSYDILAVDPKVLPVTDYSSSITVKKSGSGSTVTWTSHFTPATGVDEATADKAVTGLYQAGLGNIKKLAEK